MTSRSVLHEYTYAEYLAYEAASNAKHEFLDGEIYAMAGGTPEHAQISVAVAAALLGQLAGGPCRVFSSDLRVRVPASGLTTYPDVSVVCGPLERDASSRETILNPTVLIEVLSDGTERYDRGEKFAHYQKLASLQQYVLLSQKAPRVEVWTRVEEGTWSERSAGAGERLELESIGCALVVDEVYRDVFEA